jgi:hypothetical protein
MTASDRKADANRRNAKRSTGPKTPAGKAKAAKNAFRHGLSRVQPPDGAAAGEALALAQALTAGRSNVAERARVAAENLLYLQKLRRARAAALARALEAVRAGQDALLSAPEQEALAVRAALTELLTLTGYERKAGSRLRKMLRAL